MIGTVPPGEENARRLAGIERAAFPDRLHPRTTADFGHVLAGTLETVLADADLARGFVILRLAADEGEIIDIGVVPEARGRGTGRTLMEAAIALAEEQGAAHLFLEVATGNGPARALYAAVGFSKLGVRKGYYQRPGGVREDALILGRDLRTCPP